ncbi:MAG: two component transcriptional regulator, winged helix family, two-component system, OmpR family, alkaline phosphatase synthesis response regulator PhoP [Candidatus Peregrinibacteria bacterium GW2011_GWF2_39_17]|nr:MAG: two component transcriptional regulator, winged helix family, two-component system, OmpR family, alkaline phosphatase synthesis response regulator PhoP [Candidatus Peregrinibacteria bacterium GW2011_GWF2_39_17]HCW31876.1 DNA-binding response regulator [Candidatus Peregrinibacteria bacterium]
MNQSTLLIVEDDENIAALVKKYAEKAGFRVIVALDGQTGLDYAEQIDADCIILDLMLPSISGVDILKQLRKTKDTPVIILTAKVEEVEMLLGLELGADDYVTKPFKPNVLMARVKAILRRSQSNLNNEKTEIIQVGALKIDGAKHSIWLEDKELEFSPIEMRLISLLASHPGQVFSRDQLMEKIYEGKGKFVFDRTVDVHIGNIRKKLGEDPKQPRFIQSVFGVGYKFKEQ